MEVKEIKKVREVKCKRAVSASGTRHYVRRASTCTIFAFPNAP